MSEYSLFEFMRQIEKAVNAEVLDKNDRHVLWHYIVHQHQQFDYVFADPIVGQQIMGSNKSKIPKYSRQRLTSLGIIKTERAYTPMQGNYISVCYDWKFTPGLKSPGLKSSGLKSSGLKSSGQKTTDPKTTDPKTTGYINDLYDQGVDQSNARSDQGVDRIDEGKESDDGAAAEPPPAPAFSETAPKKTGSTGKAQEQPRPFMAADYSEEDPAQEKPKKKPKGKGKAAGKAKQEFIPPTLEKVIADIEIKLEKKGKREFWTSDQIRNFADDFMEHYTDPAINWTNKYGNPIQSWSLTLATWLKIVDYLPQERTTRNQPQQKQLAGQKKTSSSYLDELMTDATAVL